MKVNEIVEELIDEVTASNIIARLYDNKVQKWSLVIIGVCIFIGLVTFFIDSKSIVIGVVMIISLLMVIIFSVNNTFLQMKYMLAPAKEYLSELHSRINRESMLVQRLTSYDSWSLCKAKQRLIFEADKLENRIGALVGALNKLGLFPALIALYIAIAKVFGSTNFTDIPYLLLAFVAGLYLAAFSAVNIIGRLREYAFIIGIAEDLRNQVEDVAKEHK
ncbi:hypothetical protein Q4506_09525 [Colwellia sp. 4_MG-2023]|uniref:hypothetical protein n=1 Tax=unclassified Colwellia TaxID=196834 RepID=UPI0026E39E08|nr:MULTISPECIES: hypothetical protein [unclassified Colwellia]MDO6507031.1 hypothetical protein [Colwellia sp. 5_MG-2023]MDO6555923.1 hypothetical protein [Colwellia sp. 4_MG-2023]